MMIQKLKIPKSINWDDTPDGLIQRHEIIVGVYETVNQLVDAVNSLRDDCNLLMGYIAPEDKCEPTISKMEKVETSAKKETFVSIDEALNTATAKELARTRKALDVAITELKNVVEDDDFDIYMRQLSAQTTLEEINEITKGGK